MVDSRASHIAAVATVLFVVAVGPADAQFRAAAEVSSGYQLRHAGGSGILAVFRRRGQRTRCTVGGRERLQIRPLMCSGRRQNRTADLQGLASGP